MDSIINFFKEKSHLILVSPQFPNEKKKQLIDIVAKQALNEHLWVLSSGTESNRQGRTKVVALSKNAILSAAESVSSFFDLDSQDVILNTLPIHHVSGAMQRARAYVINAEFIDASSASWNPNAFRENLQTKQVTVTSLVPTQIFDLVQQGLKPPASLRRVFVGGGALEGSLLAKSFELGWPLTLTYGMTETCAMIAHRASDKTRWQRLPHLLAWKHNGDERLQLKGSSLLTGYILFDQSHAEWVDPKVDGWYATDDRAHIEQDEMTLLGRESEIVKIKGESVSLVEVNKWWQEFCLMSNVSSHSTVVVPVSHPRDGFALAIVSEERLAFEQITEFQNKLPAFCKIQKIFEKTLIPRTDLGKIKMSELVKSLNEN